MNSQENFWAGPVGDSWARNRNEHSKAFGPWERDVGMELKELMRPYFTMLPRDISIMEFGTNDGFVLKCLHDEFGYNDLHGIDINKIAVDNCKKNNPYATIQQSSIAGLKFVRQYDLCMHNSVMMHVHPDNLLEHMTIIYTHAKKYIFGRELSTDEAQPSPSGHFKGQYWTRKFADFWMDHFNLKPIKIEYHPMKSQAKVSTEVFLLEKTEL